MARWAVSAPTLPRILRKHAVAGALSPSHPLTTRKPDEIIGLHADARIRVDEFIGQVLALSAQLPQRSYVINLARNRYAFLLGFCAAIVAGQCTLLPPNRQRATLAGLLEEYPDCYFLEDPGNDEAPGFGIDLERLATTAPVGDVPQVPLDQCVAILFTSGSTGDSTAHPKYWETIRGGAIANKQCYALGDDPVHLLATVPSQHNWGLETSILLPLFSSIAISSDVPLFPQDIADALARLPEPRAVVSSPIHLNSLLESGIDTVGVDHILSATAPMSRGLAERLEKRFGARVSEVFGCSEAGSLASRAPATEELWHISDPFTFTIRNDKVRISAPHLPEDVVLNDIVEIVDERYFRWLGRDQDMINIAGKRGSLAHLNHKLSKVPGVRDGVIFLPREDSQRLAGLAVAPGISASAILDAMKESVDPAFLPRPLYVVPMLPRQETGKLARRAVLALFESQRSKAEDGEEPADQAS